MISWEQIALRLPIIFPEGIKNREHSVWDIAAKTIFVLLYAGAIEGSARWVRPDQVTRMTDLQANSLDEESRTAWTKSTVQPGRNEVPGRWYAGNTRESIRDDTIKNSLIPNNVVIEREGLAVTSPAPRYALKSEFAGLMVPDLDEATFAAKAAAWREKHLNAGALARIEIVRRGAVSSGDKVLVNFPSGEKRSMTPGQSADISKAVIEDFAPRFLQKPGVIFLSESGNKVVERDDQLAKAIGLNIPAEKSLPDIVLVDLGPQHPLLVFVEVVWSDGPVSEERKKALLKIATDAGFAPEHVAFMTAFLDRSSKAFKKSVDSLAWGSYAWFASEPDKLILLKESPAPISGV